MIDTISAADQ